METGIAAAALGLGVVNLWYGVLRPWWRGREAHPEARLESLSYATARGWQADERAVLVNHGPAMMRQVTVQLLDTAGGEYDPGDDMWPSMPIPELHVGQVIHLPLILTYGHEPLGSAVLSWRDGRREMQKRTFWVTWQHVT